MSLILNSPGVVCQGPSLYGDTDSLFTEVTPCLLSLLRAAPITPKAGPKPGLGLPVSCNLLPWSFVGGEEWPPRQAERRADPGRPCPPARSSS